MIKKLFLLLLFILSHAFLYYHVRKVNPPLPSHIQFAVVDLGEIRLKASIYKVSVNKIDQEYQKAQKKSLEYEKILRNLDAEIKELQKNTDDKTLAQLENKKKISEAKIKEAQRFAYDKKNEINRYIAQIENKLTKILDQTLQKIIKKRQISIVFTKEIAGNSIILQAHPSLDITNEVLTEFESISKNFPFEEIER